MPFSLASSTKKIASIRSHIYSGGFCPYRLRGAYPSYTIDAALLTGAAYTRASRARLLVGQAQNHVHPVLDTPSPSRWTAHRHTALRQRRMVNAYTGAFPGLPRGYVDCVLVGS